ncbi:MAG: hydrolase [Endozoicomonas sp.]
MSANILTPCQPWLDWLNDQQQDMLEKTIALANINSGSLNSLGVNQVLKSLQELTLPLAGEQTVIELKPFTVINDRGEEIQQQLGNALRIRKRPEASFQVFLCGHMDTVFSRDHHFQTVRQINDDTLSGPGVTDLKGGILVMIKALEALEHSPWAEHMGWEILFNPDEEIGSPRSSALIAEAAKRVDVGMIFEPSFPDGSLAGSRKGSGNFTAICYGKAAHAGREHHLGRNAIRTMCDFASAIDKLNGKRRGVTFNPGYIHGGGATNIVPDRCALKFNIRIEQPDDEAWCLEQMQMLVNSIGGKEGIRLELHGSFGRRPKVLTPANQRLLSLAKECGNALSMAIDIKSTGGCCDGNNLASAGIPNIDTLGVQGGNIHSDQEYMLISSLVPRAKLSAALLMTMARNEMEGGNDWLRN